MAPIVQVAIGILFVFSLLSLLVTQINTFIGNLLNWRAKNLKEGVLLLISDKELQAKILAHPLIKLVEARLPTLGLAEQNALPDKGMANAYEDIINAPTTKVANIEPSTFVEALISILSSQGGTAIFDLVEQGIDALPNNDLKLKLRQELRDLKSFSDTDTSTLRDSIMQIPDNDQKALLSYALENAEDSLGRLSVKSGQMIPLLEGINKISDKVFQDALKTILTTAQSLEDARNKLECWFNDGMTRTSDLYKSKIAYVSFGVGLLLAVVLNVDTLMLAKSLWNDQNLRDQVAAVAQVAAAQNTLSSAATPTPEASSSGVPATEVPSAQAATVQSGQDALQTLNNLLSLNLPIGWEYTNVNDQLQQDCTKTLSEAAPANSTPSAESVNSCVQNTIQSQVDSGLGDPHENTRNFWNLLPGNSGTWFTNLIWKIIGLLVTAVAAAQGAPFWFDLLKRLTGGSSSSQAAPTVNVTTPTITVTTPAPAPVTVSVPAAPEPETVYRNPDILMPDDTNVG